MLSKMYLTNFLSFKRRTEFDFTASKYCILKQTNVNAKEILKGTLFIGPNASGKTNALKALSVTDIDITQVSISKAEEVGSYHLMKAQNPVFIVSCNGTGTM